jgi:hypothetical protein
VALSPLTRVQQATVLVLVESRRLDVVTTDVARVTSFLRQAEERLNQLPLLTSGREVVAYYSLNAPCRAPRPGIGRARRHSAAGEPLVLYLRVKTTLALPGWIPPVRPTYWVKPAGLLR